MYNTLSLDIFIVWKLQKLWLLHVHCIALLNRPNVTYTSDAADTAVSDQVLTETLRLVASSIAVVQAILQVSTTTVRFQ